LPLVSFWSEYGQEGGAGIKVEKNSWSDTNFKWGGHAEPCPLSPTTITQCYAIANWGYVDFGIAPSDIGFVLSLFFKIDTVR
jgi:hypothetical protein